MMLRGSIHGVSGLGAVSGLACVGCCVFVVLPVLRDDVAGGGDCD